MSRVYISGPMTGLPGMNFEAFHTAAARLRELGFEVVNPVELHPAGVEKTWNEYLRGDLRALCECDLMVLLEGWEDSRGARLEWIVARGLGMDVVELRDANLEGRLRKI